MGSCYEHLSAEERGVVMAMKARESSARAIAQVLGRAPSTISRELRRNGFRASSERPALGRPPVCGGYDAVRAGKRARRLRRRRRGWRKLNPAGWLWREVCGLLAHRLSPEQVAGKLRRLHPDEPAWHVSHETIYTAIYAMPRGELRRQVIALLRQHKCARRPRGQGSNRRGQMKDLPSIHIRPPEAQERLFPGHWEGDLIVGARNQSAVGTLVDRHSLFLMLVKIDDMTSTGVLESFSRTFGDLPKEAIKTLTYDQGKEMAQYRRLEERTGLRVYFADPHSPWQRGICENTNGLLRQYLPKGTDLSIYTQRELDAIAWEMNNRPRKTLEFASPAEVFFKHFPPGTMERLSGAFGP